MTIRLVDAAKYYKSLPHQMKAFDWLQEKIPGHVIEEFAIKYRTPEVVVKKFPNTWEGVIEAAKEAGAKYPEVVAAQWALESGWGNHTSGRYNFFGLKGVGTEVNTQEYINGEWVTIKDGFIDFPSLYASIEYLVTRWYKDYKNFKGVNRANNRNHCAHLLMQEGYATDPGYATKLVQIMDKQLGTPGNVVVTPKFEPKSPFSFQVTPHIRYGEFCLDQEQRRFTHQYQCDTAKELCQFLEDVRSFFGKKPIVITSGHRPPAINAAVGGASNSEHLFNGKDIGAVDFYINGADIYKVQDYCVKNWPYSVGLGAKKGFVHLGIRSGRPKVRWDY